MKQLFIVHPESGAIIDLSTATFLVDSLSVPERVDALDVTEYILDNASKVGYRLDNYNMTNLFFGGNE